MSEDMDIKNKYNQIIDCMCQEILKKLESSENWKISLNEPTCGWTKFSLNNSALSFGIESARSLFCFFHPHGINLPEDKQKAIIEAAIKLRIEAEKVAKYKQFTGTIQVIKKLFPDCVPSE